MSNYYLIHNDDGDTTVRELSKEQAEQWINDGSVRQWITDGAFSADTSYWDGRYLLIKGEIVMPMPVDVVKRYELP